MKLLKAIIGEAVGMFVDDGRLALLAVLAIALVTVAVKLFTLPPLWGGILLLGLCVAILATSVVRAARR